MEMLILSDDDDCLLMDDDDEISEDEYEFDQQTNYSTADESTFWSSQLYDSDYSEDEEEESDEDEEAHQEFISNLKMIDLQISNQLYTNIRRKHNSTWVK